MSFVVYKIVNKLNLRCYYGSTCDLERRWGDHKSTARHLMRRLQNQPLYKDMNDLGIENFSIEQIAIFKTKKQSLAAEESLIRNDPTTYNLNFNSSNSYERQNRKDVILKLTKGKQTTINNIARHSCVGKDELNLKNKYFNIVKIDENLKKELEVYSWSLTPGNFGKFKKWKANKNKPLESKLYAVHSQYVFEETKNVILCKQIYLQKMVWELANGPLKKGERVGFKDGNGLNCKLENLYLCHRTAEKKATDKRD